MKWRTYFRQALRTPPHVTLREGSRILVREVREAADRRRDRRRPTLTIEGSPPRILRRVHGIDLRTVGAGPDVQEVARRALRHEFDLLGSGWVQVRHGMQAAGIEGHRFPAAATVDADPDGVWLAGHVNKANLPVARRIWSLIGPGHVPIDWHIDFVSGYRWDPCAPSTQLGPAPARGADIKVPWELARMQHLPALAEAYAATDDAMKKERFVAAFRDQILDFIATNPPRYGANWTTPMDVGIRAVNWLIAYDMFRDLGHTFDDAFEDVLGHALIAHARHIVGHLEWNSLHRGNHYLSNVACLAIIASFLPSALEHDAWLALALQELRAETEHQFHNDGSNFEASTCYHRLSGEFVVFATAALLGVDPERWGTIEAVRPGTVRSDPPLRPGLHADPDALFDDGHWDRIERIAEFVLDITRPDGRIPQVGDNDSGRLLKTVPVLVGGREDHLDHRSIVAAVAGLVDRKDLMEFAHGLETERDLVRCLAGRPQRPAARDGTTAARSVRVGDPDDLGEGPDDVHRHAQDLGPAFVDAITAVYPDFGLVVHKNGPDYLVFRCGPVGQDGNGGHAHNDQLSIELWRDGRPLAVDPGTYVYTSLPDRRDDYRSVQAHFAPCIEGQEPSRMDTGTFRLPDPGARLLVAGPEGCLGVHHGNGVPLQRMVRFTPALRIVDACALPLAPLPVPSVDAHCRIPFSPGYGLLEGPGSAA